VSKFEEKGKKEPGFSIFYAEEGSVFQASSEIDCQEWMKVIKEIQAESKKGTDTNKELQKSAK
jgi:hypothetical protein